MANEQGGAPEAPEGLEDLCDRCGVPLPEPRRWVCMLGAGCCPDCFAECEKTGRCDKVRDPEVWAKIEYLRRLVRDPKDTSGRKV